jgi:hypothetical protein
MMVADAGPAIPRARSAAVTAGDERNIRRAYRRAVDLVTPSREAGSVTRLKRLRSLLGLDEAEWAWITRGWDRHTAAILTVSAVVLTVFRAYGSPAAFQRFQWGLGNHPRFLVFADLWWFASAAVLLGLVPLATLWWLSRGEASAARGPDGGPPIPETSPSQAGMTAPHFGLGLGLGDRRYGLKGSAVLLAVMLPVIFVASRDSSFYRYYPISDWLGDKAVDYATSGQPSDWLVWLVVYELAYAVYFLGWEYFFRGFLTLGLHARLGILGIFVGNIPFALMHANKPFAEALGSVVAGLALGVFALRARSFWYAWAVHVVAALSMDLLALERRISLGG